MICIKIIEGNCATLGSCVNGNFDSNLLEMLSFTRLEMYLLLYSLYCPRLDAIDCICKTEE